MATGTITKVTNDSANGYCKMPDGTLIQWGQVSTPAISANSQVYVQVTFTVPFISTPSICTATGTNSPNARWTGYYDDSKTGFKLSAGVLSQAATNGIGAKWQAIGRWK